MKSIGVVRRVDELGRIVIPIELRRELGILSYKEKGSSKRSDSDAVEIYSDGDTIILKKYQPNCIFCGSMKGITNYKGRNVCKKCISEMERIK